MNIFETLEEPNPSLDEPTACSFCDSENLLRLYITHEDSPIEFLDSSGTTPYLHLKRVLFSEADYKKHPLLP